MGVQVKNVKKPSSTHITLKVKNQDENLVLFRIGKNVQLRKLMYAYCVHQCARDGTLRFIYDGFGLKPEQTPDELGMEDGYEIDAFNEVTSA